MNSLELAKRYIKRNPAKRKKSKLDEHNKAIKFLLNNNHSLLYIQIFLQNECECKVAYSTLRDYCDRRFNKKSEIEEAAEKYEKIKSYCANLKNKYININQEQRNNIETVIEIIDYFVENSRQLQNEMNKKQEQKNVNNDDNKKVKTIEQKNVIKEETAKEKNKVVTKKPENNIPIKLIDGTIEMCNERYLRTCAIMDLNSRIKNDFLEENIYLIKNSFQGKKYDFNEYAEKLKKKQIIENYSLVIHNNSNKDLKAYVYRYIDKELVLLYDFSAAELLDIGTIERKARNKFLDTKEFFE